MSHTARFVLRIPNGQQNSAALSTLLTTKGQARSTFGNTEDLVIYAPAALTNAVNIQIDPKYGSGNWRNVSDGVGDIAVPAGKAVQIKLGAAEDLRLRSAGAEGADRDFEVVFQINME